MLFPNCSTPTVFVVNVPSCMGRTGKVHDVIIPTPVRCPKIRGHDPHDEENCDLAASENKFVPKKARFSARIPRFWKTVNKRPRDGKRRRDPSGRGRVSLPLSDQVTVRRASDYVPTLARTSAFRNFSTASMKAIDGTSRISAVIDAIW